MLPSPRVKFQFKSENAEKLRLAVVEQVRVQNNYNFAPNAIAQARIYPFLQAINFKVARLTRLATGSENEILILTIVNPALITILGSVVNRYTFHSAGPTVPAPGPSDEFTMGNITAFPPPSKSVTIETRMQIDGDEYDASGMFGVPSSVAPVGKVTITPEITIRELALVKGENNQNKIKVNEMLDDYLGFSRIGPPGPIALERISDYGILNFSGGTGFRVTVFNPAAPLAPAAITVLDAVDLSKIVSKANSGANDSKLKTEIIEKTGLYINNSLLQAKVPVITYTDILNSLFIGIHVFLHRK